MKGGVLEVDDLVIVSVLIGCGLGPGLPEVQKIAPAIRRTSHLYARDSGPKSADSPWLSKDQQCR